ncbi:MAG TPA: hypothetical protein VFO86_01365, partial [Terriglobia bacterium]|nr:hypothetical protein [Terriglobia bacterium]
MIGINAVICLMLSAYGVKINWSYIRTVQSDGGVAALFTYADERQNLIKLPSRYYGIRDYATPDRFPRLTDEEVKTSVPVVFRVILRDEFGTFQPAQVDVEKTQWVRTNVQGFPWNRLEIDGQDVPESEMRSY